MTRVKQLYAQRLAAGQVTPDPAQAEAVDRLDALAKQLGASRGWFGGAKPRGLYIWGAVGRGKSMLMDLFFEAVTQKDKRRVHFHDFMLETHAFIFEWRKLSQAEKRKHPAHVPRIDYPCIALKGASAIPRRCRVRWLCNRPARRLYQQLGFADGYRYRYRAESAEAH